MVLVEQVMVELELVKRVVKVELVVAELELVKQVV